MTEQSSLFYNTPSAPPLPSALLVVLVTAAAFLLPRPATADDAPAPTPEQIQAWIKQLGDDSFQVREAATKALMNAGNAAFDPILASQEGEDPEIRARCIEIEQKLIATAIEELQALGAEFSANNSDDINCVVLYEKEIKDSDFAPLARLRKLEFIYLERLQITNASLAFLESLDEVKKVSLIDTRVSDKGLEFLQRMPRLSRLNLDGCPVGDETARRLTANRELQFLHLSRTRVTDKGITPLGALPKLRGLYLDDTTVTGAGLRSFAPLGEQVVVLHLSGANIDDEGAAELAAFTGLEILELNRTAISDSALTHFKPLKQTRILRLKGCSITDAGLRHLLELRSLQWLSLDGSDITPKGLAALKHLPALRMIDVPESWSKEDLAKARAALPANANGKGVLLLQRPHLFRTDP